MSLAATRRFGRPPRPPLRPWTVTFDGMVEQERQVGIDDLFKAMQPFEERVYRHRCVEAWAMTVPWSGFPMRKLVEYAKPLSSAKYVRMQTFQDPEVAPGQRQYWYPWPYVEGLTIAEATNEQRLWGPDSMASRCRNRTARRCGWSFPEIRFQVDQVDRAVHLHRPTALVVLEELQSAEYGFWANVNPKVPHPRWSQATERLLGSDERVPTQLYNGYGEFVAELYSGLKGERLYM